MDMVRKEGVNFFPVDDIFVDYEWNGRSYSNVMSQESDGAQDTTARGEHQSLGLGLAGLEKTLEMRGQDTPCVFRPVHGVSLGGHRTPLQLELVCGFRRITAIKNLYKRGVEIPGLPKGALFGIVRELTPVEACILNGRENTDRQGLSTTDMLRVVTRLSALGVPLRNIATELGVTYGYVARLNQVSRLPKVVLDHWQGEGTLQAPPVKLRLIDLATLEREAAIQQLSPEQTTDLYIKKLQPIKKLAQTQDPHARRIELIAELVAGLVRLEVLQEGNLEWSRVIGPKKDGFLVDVGNISAAERARYWALARKYYALYRDPPIRE